MHTLRQVIQRLNLISAEPEAMVIDVAIAMSEGRIGAIPIIEGERLVGIFSERDLMTRVVVAGRDPRATRVAEVMTHEVLTAGLDESVDRCLQRMQRAGCRHLPGRARAIPDCPGEWAPTQAIDGDFLVRQRLLVVRGERAFALELVARKRGDELLLLGLHPLGGKLFTLRQRGLETSVDAAPAPALEVPPLNVLRDFHRARFLGLASAGPDGSYVERRDGTEVREIHEAGQLRLRSFRRLAGDPPGSVELRFDTPAAAGGGAARVWIDNGWCGYRAELTTLSEELLR